MLERKFFIDIDDFGLLLPGLDDLLRIKQHYKDFKITCFTIPFPKEFFLPDNQKLMTGTKYKKWAEFINEYDWIEIAMHGFTHTEREFDCSYKKAEVMLKAAENLWKEVGLKYKKIFRAPYWQYSYDSLNCLKDKGYVVALDRNHPVAVPEGLKTYTYNWSFEEGIIKQIEQVKGHGHAYNTGGTKNPIDLCYENIIKQIPANARFEFVSQLCL